MKHPINESMSSGRAYVKKWGLNEEMKKKLNERRWTDEI